jgi:hypothetical protein
MLRIKSFHITLGEICLLNIPSERQFELSKAQKVFKKTIEDYIKERAPIVGDEERFVLENLRDQFRFHENEVSVWGDLWDVLNNDETVHGYFYELPFIINEKLSEIGYFMDNCDNTSWTFEKS